MSGGLWLGPAPTGGEVEGFDLTTKGDLHGYDTAQARVPIGNNGEVLTADSAQGLGLKWAALGAWTTWSPSYVNLTVGNGTVTARYTQIGDLVIARFKLLFGSTTTIDGSGVTVSLPVNAATTGASGDGPPIGLAAMREDGNVTFLGVVVVNSATTLLISPTTDSGSWERMSVVSATQPFTWGTDDELSFMTNPYEAA